MARPKKPKIGTHVTVPKREGMSYFDEDCTAGTYGYHRAGWTKRIEKGIYINGSSVSDVIEILTEVRKGFDAGLSEVYLEVKCGYDGEYEGIVLEGERLATEEEIARINEHLEHLKKAVEDAEARDIEFFKSRYPDYEIVKKTEA